MDEPAKPIPGKAAAPPKPAPPRPSSQHELREKRGDDKPVTIQRKCGCDAAGGKCDDCGKKPLQRKGNGPAPAVSEAVTAPMEQSAGEPLAPELKEEMESRFGQDFSEVRVYTDAPAATAARNVDARAFTTGKRIYFAEGEYRPETARGRELLAHELTHIVQQRDGTATATGVGAFDDPFEREADRAAQEVMRGERPGVGLKGGGDAIRRAGPPEQHKVATKPVPTPLKVPALKTSPKDGNGLLGIYTRAAKARALRTTHAGRSSEEGTSTETLWNKWAATRPASFFGKGGKTDAAEKKLIDGRRAHKCQVDHILELQVGGADDPNNMRLLDGPRNMTAGSRIAGQLKSLYADDTLMKGLGVPASEDKPILEFTSVVIDGSPDADPECLDWELKRAGGIAETSDSEYTIETHISGSPASIFADDKKSIVNQSKYAVPGFQLDVGRDLPKDEWELDSVLSPKIRRIPVLKPAPKYVFKAAGKNAPIQLLDRKLAAEFPNLSKAELDMRIEEGKLIADGILKPSHPLFKHVDVLLHLEEEKLTATAKITPDLLKKALPIPGLEITETTLGLAFAGKEFSVSGGFALKYTTIADGRVQARFGKNGFEATGDLELHIPGLTEAKGKIWYREEKLGGQVKIGAKQLKVPGIKSANVAVTIEDGMLAGTGTIDLGVPGVKKADIAFSVDQKGNFAVSGAAAISVPGLKEGNVELKYANGDLTGVAKLGLAVPGLESAIFEIHYARGQISGKGDIAFRKGKLAGSLHAELTEKHTVKGGGELGYEIMPGVIALVGIELLEDGTTKVSGEVRIPEMIPIFPEKAFSKKLFDFNVQIPIFAIPLGTDSVGLVAEIGSYMTARAGIGPGQLRGVKAKATLDLSKDTDALEFEAAAELYVPAFAELRLAVYGGVGLSLAIASATGGIELAASLGVYGALSNSIQLKYAQGQFVLDAVAEVTAQPKLTFEVNAYVKVEVDLVLTTIEVYREDWKLASKEWGSGFTVGLRFPVHYESAKPFEISLAQVEFIKPEIDVAQAVKDLLPM